MSLIITDSIISVFSGTILVCFLNFGAHLYAVTVKQKIIYFSFTRKRERCLLFLM